MLQNSKVLFEVSTQGIFSSFKNNHQSYEDSIAKCFFLIKISPTKYNILNKTFNVIILTKIY